MGEDQALFVDAAPVVQVEGAQFAVSAPYDRRELGEGVGTRRAVAGVKGRASATCCCSCDPKMHRPLPHP